MSYLKERAVLTLLLMLALSDSALSESCVNISGDYLVDQKKVGDRFNPLYDFFWGISSCENCKVDKVIVEQEACSNVRIKPISGSSALSTIEFNINEFDESKLLVKEERNRKKNDPVKL